MKILALLVQEMISLSINACFQILLLSSLFIILLYTCNWIEVYKMLFTLMLNEGRKYCRMLPLAIISLENIFWSSF